MREGLNIDRTSAVALMSNVIVRLFQDRESVTDRDLIEAGFTAKEIGDYFEAASIEAAPRCTGATTHLALSLDPLTVRRTSSWEKATTLAPAATPEAAIAAVASVSPHRPSSHMADRDNVFIVCLIDGSVEFIEFDIDERMIFNVRDERAAQILDSYLARGRRLISGRVFDGDRSSRITLLIDKIASLKPVWPCDPHTPDRWPRSLYRAMFSEEAAA